MRASWLTTRWTRTLVPWIVGLLLWQPIAAGQSSDEWSALDAQSVTRYAAGDLAGAIEAAEGALRIAATPAQSGRSLSQLGFLLHTVGRSEEGEKHLRQSLDIRGAAFGADSLEYAESANNMAVLLRDRDRTDEAKDFAERALATRERALPPNDSLLAESLNILGSVLATAGEYAAAVRPMERAVAIHESRAEADRAVEEYGTLCANLASAYHRLGRYGAATQTFEKALGILRVKPGPDHPAYAVTLLANASVVVDLGRYADAERLYDEGVRSLRASLTEAHPLYAVVLNNRGFLYQSLGNSTAAERDFRESLELKRAQKASPQSMASSLRNLAQVLYPRDRAEAERLLVEAVAVYDGLPGARPFDYASVLLGLARAQRDRGALDEARATAERALVTIREGIGDGHPMYAAAMRDLGLVYAARGDATNARQHLADALVLAERALPAIHPDLAGYLDNLAVFHAGRGAYAEALPLYRRSAEIRERFLDDALEVGAESFKAESIAALDEQNAALITFQATAAAQAPEARALAFEVVTRRKGRVLEQARNWRERLRGVTDPAARRVLAEWQALLECRTSLALALGYHEFRPATVGGCDLEGTSMAGRYQQLLVNVRAASTDALAAEAVGAIAALRERGDVLEAALNRAVGSAAARPLATAETIAAQLAPDEILIEFVSYQTGASAAARGRRFGAFVLDARGDLEWADIGPAPAIDASVRALLDAANDWTISVRNGERLARTASEQTAHDALDEISSRVWAPLSSTLNRRRGVRRLRISPDGSLNLVPFEALSDGRELIDRFAISYLPAGRDLVQEPARASSTSPVVVVSPGARFAVDRTIARTMRADVLAYLPEAASEAEEVRRVVPAAALVSITDATEQFVKKLRAPVLLHVAGHGIVVGQDCTGASCPPAQADRPANAMSLSAIVLEEAYGRAAGSPDDGMMTPLELQNVDLRGTEMLVLSHCQMANGAASVGEGVYGMRRAAAVAGARTFVAPLWNVDDRVQRTLMRRFYRALAGGASRVEALRQAKLALRRATETRSFLYWAPVILTGSADPLPPSIFQPDFGRVEAARGTPGAVAPGAAARR